MRQTRQSARSARRRPVRTGLGRAVRWIDDWTVEAFNPVYPYRGSDRR
ncbi:hypothetical protein [Allokutzneria albata]|uniref:Uncharacterized protein n=1 Tax=Allokutzneria albata TaxID=211114 RepID=A0A1G9XRV0_ALLAB|nr:hypothetical protein [Allokutzneria albata]SDM99241.1 hypothetical protein SAMN04489726_4361 [Allokutzneria albata]